MSKITYSYEHTANFLSLTSGTGQQLPAAVRIIDIWNYKGIEYQVVQTSSPTGWKWTVEMEGRRPRVGGGHSRAAAIALAQIAIDRLVKQDPENRSDRL